MAQEFNPSTVNVSIGHTNPDKDHLYYHYKDKYDEDYDDDPYANDKLCNITYY